MGRKKKHAALSTAKEFSDYLLYEITGGNMGKEPDIKIKNSSATFGEKRGLLDSLIKIAALEKGEEGEEEASGFDKIKRDLERKNRLNASGEIGNSGNTESTSYNGGEASGDSVDSSDQ